MTSGIFLQNRVVDKTETWYTRSLDDEPIFTPVEQKLVTLALDPAAHAGEVDVCATKLFHSLRRRGVNADRIIRTSAQSTWAARELSAARGRVVTFGKKYRGKTIGEVPPAYLRWALENFRDLPLNVRAAMQLVLKEGRAPANER